MTFPEIGPKAKSLLELFAQPGSSAPTHMACPPLCPQVGMEEFYDYIFPEESSASALNKLLAAAQAWKKQKTGDS